MAYSTDSSDLPKQFDPTGQVDLEDAAAVETAVCAILDRQYGDGTGGAGSGVAHVGRVSLRMRIGLPKVY